MIETSDYMKSKIERLISLDSIIYFLNYSCKFFDDLAKMPILIKPAELFGIEEILPDACSKTSSHSEFEYYLCKLETKLCDLVLMFTDFIPVYDNDKMMTTFLQHYPGGYRLRCLIHFSQNLLQLNQQDPKFLMYDYGVAGNLVLYGRKKTPEFDIGKIKVPVNMLTALRTTAARY